MGMVQSIRLVAVFALLFALGTPPGVSAAADRFVAGMEGVPLMTGLTEIADGHVEIDTPAGRIIQASATGAASKAEVLAFYAEALPRIGWRPEGAGVFCREGKVLAIEPEESESPWVTVRFALFPDGETKIP